MCDMAEKYEQCDRSCQPKDDLRKRRDVKDELRRRRDVSPAMSRRDVGPETFRADLAGAMYMMGGSDIDDQVNAITPKPGGSKCEKYLANKLVTVHSLYKVFTDAVFMLGQRHRRWAGMEPVLDQCLVVAGYLMSNRKYRNRKKNPYRLHPWQSIRI